MGHWTGLLTQRRIIIAIATIASVTAITALVVYLRPTILSVAQTGIGQPPLPAEPSIAVLPFANMSGDPEQEYFADGVTETIITDLSKLRGLKVIARNSVFTYKGKAVDVREVSRNLGARYVLEGSIQKGEGRLRVTLSSLMQLRGSTSGRTAMTNH